MAANGPPRSADTVAWHALPFGEVAARLETDSGSGLSLDEATRRLERHGPNLLAEQHGPGALDLLLHQFASLLVYVLLAAAVVSLLLGDYLEAASIVVIAVLNAALGFVQEYRAEKALSALKAMSAPGATVLREGSPERIAARDVVPGDILILEAGDIVAADGRLLEANSLAVTEAVLTGESVAAEKSAAPVAAEAEMADRVSMVYQGTIAARGRGRAVVTATGGRTEVGRIANLISAQPREITPLQRELATVGRYLVWAAAVLCGFVFLVGILRGLAVSEMFLTAASLSVAAIPEGLPAAATIVLALGVQRMAERHAIIRRLSSVETLGSVTTIFTDKTGTLTMNQMSVQEVWAPGGEQGLLQVAVLCNNATLASEHGKESGDPLEVALLAHARGKGVDIEREAERFVREREIPFDASTARMTVVVRTPEGGRLGLVKGAPDVLLRLSNAMAGGVAKEDVAARATDMAGRSLRVLAFARRDLPATAPAAEDVEQGLVFVGLAGLADPLRPEAAGALRGAEDAGIRVVMLTGDQPATALSIGASLGLAGQPVTGREVEDLADDELRQRMLTAEVFARVTSEHKLRIIQTARASGEVVAMTGDGVNDAPALREADIGVAMGQRGTDVAREAADMVLADDNFTTIVAAIAEGRSIHANIGRFIHFLLSCNAAEIMVVFLTLLAVSEPALTPLQILFVNLLTDGLPALALGVEPADPDVMRRGPRARDSGLISARSLTPVLGMGGLIALSTLVAFGTGRALEGNQLARELAFATLVGSQLAASVVFRSETEVAWRLRRNAWLIGALAASVLALLAAFYLPPLRRALDLDTLSAGQWALVAALSLTPLIAGEAVKLNGALRRLALTPEDHS